MQAGWSRASLGLVALALSLQSAVAAVPQTINFDNATGVGTHLGTDNDPSHTNLGFEGFLWAWTGAGVAEVGHPTNAGFILGDRSNPDFTFVGGSSPLFVYFGTGSNETTAYITTAGGSFDFYGAFFSATQLSGSLSIQGQVKVGPGLGNGGFADAGSALSINFSGGEHQDIRSAAALITNVDRLVVTTTSGRGFQWAMDDFKYAAVPIPEPETWAMFGLGIVGVGFAVSRQKRAHRPARR